MTQSLDDMGKVEMVRGPGSALYGANAFSGVINITTPEAREVLGSKLTVAGGELETFRVDGRHAGLAADGRIGFRLNGGYNRSDTYSRSRTLRNGTSLQEEYADATDEPVPATVEARPLHGQTADPLTGEVAGDRDPLRNVYGSGRARLLPRQRQRALGRRRRREGGERDLRHRHRAGAGARSHQALRPCGDRGRPVQHLRLLEQPHLARAPVLADVGSAAGGAVGRLPLRGAEQLELPERPGPGGLRRLLPELQGQHLRHVDEPGERQPERRSLLRRTARWSTGSRRRCGSSGRVASTTAT